MNVIHSYLETMFSTYPQTPRMLEAKAELQGMMDDAYASLIAEGKSENEAIGRVIRDFGNIDEVAPVLGISSELSSGSRVETSETLPAQVQNAKPQFAAVTLDEAKKYSEAQRSISAKVAVSVVLFVLSPTLLILLPTASSSGYLAVNEKVAAFAGLLTVLVFVAIGVVLIVFTDQKTAPYKRISSGRFTPNPEVSRWAEKQAEEHDSKRIRALQIALIMWILSPLPLLAFSLLLEDSQARKFLSVVGVVLILVMVAAGLLVLLPKTWAQTVYETLTKTHSSTGAEGEEENSIVGVIAAFYWPAVTAIYLGWSFIANAWASSWIIWPVAAVLFGALAGGLGAVEGYKRARR